MKVRVAASGSCGDPLRPANGRPRRRRSLQGAASTKIDRRCPSHQRGEPDTGFDVALAQVIARSVRTAAQDPMVRKQARRGSRARQLEANALLSDGRCSLVGGYALTRRFAGRARREDGQASGFRRRDPRRSPAPRRTRRAHAQSGFTSIRR